MVTPVRPLRILITDDEPLNRQELRFLLEQHPDIEVVGEAESASDALQCIEQIDVDVVFLDIEMEEQRAGLDLAKNLTQQANPPSIIFVTAHPEYAQEGYNNYPLPLHYLLKPIDETLLAEALQRARMEINPGRLAIRHKETQHCDEPRYPIAYVEPSEIVYVQTDKPNSNTLTLHLAAMRELKGVRQTLEQIKDCLGKQIFLCPHHSFLVNPDCVSGLIPRQSGGELYNLQLKGRIEEIPVSKSKLKEIKITLESSRHSKR